MPRPRPRPIEETAQDRGRAFEAAWAKTFGVKPQPGSGALWFAKLDVADGTILWSLKHTDAQSFRLEKGLMGEVQRAIHGPGGVGGDTIPGLGIDIDGEQYVVLRADDFMRMTTAEVRYFQPSAENVKRARAGVPVLLREAE